MQQTYILLISLLAGVVAAGFVWFLWDFAEKLQEVLARRRAKHLLDKDANTLLEQAKEPAEAERPR
jgi:hypothetical protein